MVKIDSWKILKYSFPKSFTLLLNKAYMVLKYVFQNLVGLYQGKLYLKKWYSRNKNMYK